MEDMPIQVVEMMQRGRLLVLYGIPLIAVIAFMVKAVKTYFVLKALDE